MDKKYIVIVSSCINVDSSPLSYFYTRSLYSAEQRLEHTINTLKSIRNKIPNVTIIITNNNLLTPSQEIILSNECDYLLMEENTYEKTHPNKSYSETCSLLRACQFILDKKLDFDYVFKISGRYTLLDSFDINNWQFEETKIVSPMTGDKKVNNVLYSVPKSRFEYYMERLKFCSELCNKPENRNDPEANVESFLFDFKNESVHKFLTIRAHIVKNLCTVQSVYWQC